MMYQDERWLEPDDNPPKGLNAEQVAVWNDGLSGLKWERQKSITEDYIDNLSSEKLHELLLAYFDDKYDAVVAFAIEKYDKEISDDFVEDVD
jgi:hypothetical protein